MENQNLVVIHESRPVKLTLPSVIDEMGPLKFDIIWRMEKISWKCRVNKK